MKNFIKILSEELSKEEQDKHLDKNTAIRLKNKKFKLRGRMNFQGIPVSIENYKDDIRAGIDPNGDPWKIKMKYTYGFIPNKISMHDNEGIDVYIGEDTKSKMVYVVKQHKIEEVKKWPSDYCPDCKEHYSDCYCEKYFDEDKIMIGFPNKESAKNAYLKQYDDPRFLGPISSMTLLEFKDLLSGKGKNDKISIPLKY